MAIRNYKPTTNGRRKMSTLINTEITTDKPEKSLVVTIKKNGGRNNQGRITVRHKGGGEKRKYRIIDFKRNKRDIPGVVATIEYDPNRSANIALIESGEVNVLDLIAADKILIKDEALKSIEELLG